MAKRLDGDLNLLPFVRFNQGGFVMEAESTLLEGKVAVVSGIGPGLGRRAAVRLAANGADLVLGARRQSSLDEVAAEIEALGRKVITLSTDITDVDQCEALGAAAAAEFGRVDI